MAYSQGVARKNGTTFYAINLWSSRSDVSINTSRISWSADVTFGDWYYWGVRLHIAVDGVEVGSWAGACTYSGQKVISVSGTRDVGRGASSRNIQVSAWTTSETVSGYGGVGITTSCATTETIPQKGYLTPRPPKSFAASRVSDTEMGMTWQADYTGMDGDYPWSNVLIDRRTDDGDWVQIATLSWSALNYTDRTSEAGHKYEYGARASGHGGVSSRVTADALFTTPNAPTWVELSKLDGTFVRVGIDGAPKYVDKYNMQTSVNDGEWGASQEVASFPTTITASGKVKVRVQAVKGSLVSSWRESNVVTTIVAPNAPTLTAKPASVVATGSTLKIGWTRNHPDGSAQTSAQVGYTVDSKPEVVADIAGDTSTYTLPASVAAKACAVKVRVRTKGIHQDWGAWSSQYAFKVAVPPSVNFTVPGVDGAKIGDLPLVAQWDVADATGVASQRIELLDEGGSVLHSATPGNDTRKYTFGDGTYRLANATAYRLRLTVRGGSSLSVVSERVFSTSFAEPARPTALVELDSDAMSQSVTVQAGDRYSDEASVVTVEATKGTLVPGLSVFGQTRQNLWQNPSGTGNGVTVTSNEDGTIAFEGSNESSSSLIFAKDSYALVQGTTYTIDCDNIGDEVYFTVAYKKSNGQSFAFLRTSSSGPRTAIFPSDSAGATMSAIVSPGATASGTYRVMLREATEDEIAAAQSTPGTLQEGGTADLPQDRPVTLTAYPEELAATGEFDWVKPGINGAEPTALLISDKHPDDAAASTPLDLKGYQLHMLPDGTRDELAIDASGAYAKNGYIVQATFDGSSFNERVDTFFTVKTPIRAVFPNLGDMPNMLCDAVPVAPRWGSSGLPSHPACSVNSTGLITFSVPTSTDEEAKEWLNANKPSVIYQTAVKQTVELGSIAMPEFPAESSRIWAASDIPCTVRVNYPTVDSISVTRVLDDGSRWLVADGLIGGQQCIDPLPPLNTDYNYELTTATEAGASSTVALGQHIDSKGRMALNFGTAASVAHVMGANAKVSYDESAVGELYHFADGGESGGLPQFYGTGDIDASGSVSFELMGRGERDRFKRSARRYAVGWFRDAMGGRIRARMGYSESVKAGGIAVWEESVDMDEVIFEEAW